MLTTGSSIFTVPQAKNQPLSPLHVPRLREKPCWLDLQPTIQPSTNQHLPPGPSHHHLSLLAFRLLPLSHNLVARGTILQQESCCVGPLFKAHWPCTILKWKPTSTVQSKGLAPAPYSALASSPPHHWAPVTLPGTPPPLPHACRRAFALPRCCPPEPT